MISDEWLALARQQAARFWSKVDKSGDCWLWTAGKGTDGYGKYQINAKGWLDGRPVQKHVRAHKIAWEMLNGPVPDGRGLMHSCDTPLCVRPDHLSVGTQRDNMRDCASKGRTAKGQRHGSATCPQRVMRGESHYKATIGADEARKIREMRNDGATGPQVARALGVPIGIVYQVSSGKTWRSVA